MLPSSPAVVREGEGTLEPPPLPLTPPVVHVEGMKAFAAMTIGYMLFTITDGALRMIILFHAFTLGFSAWQVALMFFVYEVAGVVTNLAAGMVGARWGIRATLLCGLLTQMASILLLWGFDIPWDSPGAEWKALGYVAAAGGLGGVAKDLVKLGGKTVSKLVTPSEKQSRLFATVAWLTGAKNSLKGVGYFVGAASLSVSLSFALGLNLALIALAIPVGAFGLSKDVGRARSRNLTLATILTPAPNVRALSIARAFLFGSRDLWFEVVLPFYLRAGPGGGGGLGWSREATGAFLAGFIIVYGQVQAATPRLLLRPLGQDPPNKLVQVVWNSVLTGVGGALTLVFTVGTLFPLAAGGAHHPQQQQQQQQEQTLALCLLLGVFCVVFAVNSSVHSYLIVRYAEGDKVAADVGFYYMSNAVGRGVGTLVSGALYEWLGGGGGVAAPNRTGAMGWCFLASTLASLASTLLTLRINDQEAGLACGSFKCIAVGGGRGEDGAEDAAEVAAKEGGGEGKGEGEEGLPLPSPVSIAPPLPPQPIGPAYLST